MFVPVPCVGGVPVAVVDVVGVVAVLHRLVAAARTVLMRVLLVHDVRFELAIVVVAVMLAMDVPVVQVVDVVIVLDGHVAAAGAMLVLVTFVFTHAFTLPTRREGGQGG
jgi:hypothetical protein